MIKKITFGLLSVSALTMLTALPAFAASETEVAAEVSPSVSLENEAVLIDGGNTDGEMKNMELGHDQDGDYFIMENGEKVYITTTAGSIDNSNAVITFNKAE